MKDPCDYDPNVIDESSFFTKLDLSRLKSLKGLGTGNSESKLTEFVDFDNCINMKSLRTASF